jgi:RNA polymerase sigma factor (sigma-70 family)
MEAPNETQVIERLAPAVLSRAKRLLYGRHDDDARDLAQVGLIRILIALRGGITGTDGFLLKRALWAMSKALTRELRRTVVEVASLDDPDTNSRMEPIVRESELKEEDGPSWRQMISCMTPRERQVVAAIHHRNLTQQQTAVRLGISQQRVNQIYRKALLKLRSRFGGQ